MLSWTEIATTAESVWGGERLGEGIVKLELEVEDGRARQLVFLRQELMPPDLEFMVVDSPIGLMGEVDLEALLRSAGQLLAGGLGYVPTRERGGIITLASRLPLAALDKESLGTVLLFIQIFGGAAHGVSKQAGTQTIAKPDQDPIEALEQAFATSPPTRASTASSHADESELRAAAEADDTSAACALGQLLAERGEIDEAEAAFRRADDQGDAWAAYNLGILLESERENRVGAQEAWERGAERGHAGAAFNLGCLLQQNGDLRGAVDAWRRAEELGDSDVTYNLGLGLRQLGEGPGAEAALRRGDAAGNAAASALLGRMLEEAGELDGARSAYERADEGGDRDGAYGLGTLLYDCGDLPGAISAFRRAAERGHTGAPQILEMLQEGRA